MRVAIFIKSTTFHADHGGMEVQNKTLAEGFIKKGHEVVVYSPKGSLEKLTAAENGVEYKFIDSKYKNSTILQSILNTGAKSEWYVKSYKTFLEDNQEKKCDIVFSQSSAGLGIIRKKEELRVKVIAIAHGTIFSEFKTLLTRPKNLKNILRILKDFEYTLRTYLTRQKEFIRKADCVVAVSDFVKRNIVAETGVSKDMVTVIYNGVSDAFPDINLRVSSPFTILYVGRIERDKGLFELVENFKKHSGRKDKEVFLKIVGDGPDLAKLKGYVSKLGLNDRVVFGGFQKGAALKESYDRSRIFVLPTKRVEGFPVALAEAMMAMLPVIAFDLGGVSEAVVNGETGFLVKKGDWGAFNARLSKLIVNDQALTFMLQKARDRATSMFSKDQMVKSYLDVVQRILDK